MNKLCKCSPSRLRLAIEYAIAIIHVAAGLLFLNSIDVSRGASTLAGGPSTHAPPLTLRGWAGSGTESEVWYVHRTVLWIYVLNNTSILLLCILCFVWPASGGGGVITYGCLYVNRWLYVWIVQYTNNYEQYISWIWSIILEIKCTLSDGENMEREGG